MSNIIRDFLTSLEALEQEEFGTTHRIYKLKPDNFNELPAIFNTIPKLTVNDRGLKNIEYEVNVDIICLNEYTVDETTGQDKTLADLDNILDVLSREKNTNSSLTSNRFEINQVDIYTVEYNNTPYQCLEFKIKALVRKQTI